jgi:ketopantoate reductase
VSAVVWTGGRLLLCQNGQVGVEQFWGEGLTIGVDYPAYLSDQDRADQRGRLNRLVELLESGGGECHTTEDIQRERWMKVILYV